MMRLGQYLRFYTPDEATAILRETHAVLVAAELPEELHAVAFGKALDLLVAGQREIEQTAIGAPTMAIPRNHK